MRTNSLRIISGKWGSRRFKFPDIAQIRPTPDSVRETIFNWLQAYIADSICLDLFAGSGALGIEALSRGAGEVSFVDKNTKAISALKDNLIRLDAKGYQTFNMDALKFIKQSKTVFDIIFLDPPFASDLLENTLDLITQSAIIKPDTFLCIETENPELVLTDKLTVLKSAKAGHSKVYLSKLC